MSTLNRRTREPRWECQAGSHLLGPLVSFLMISFFKVTHTFFVSTFSVTSHILLNIIKTLYCRCQMPGLQTCTSQPQLGPPWSCRGDNDNAVGVLPCLRVTRMLSATNWKAPCTARGHFPQEPYKQIGGGQGKRREEMFPGGKQLGQS